MRIVFRLRETFYIRNQVRMDIVTPIHTAPNETIRKPRVSPWKHDHTFIAGLYIHSHLSPDIDIFSRRRYKPVLVTKSA